MKNKYDARLYRVVRPIISLLFKIIYNPKIVGKENIKKEGRIILAGNHTNILDAVLLMSTTKRSIHFLAKDELWKGLKRVIFSNMGLIPVNRRTKDKNALKEAIKYLNNDQVIGIFPEGTIGKNGLLPFKMGAVKMAYETKSKILPFVITGKYRIFFNDLKIEFLEEVEIKSDDLEKENEKLRSKISKMVGVK